MQGDFFAKPHRRHQKDLNIVPILDMMTTVIFFLLLATSFVEFTKITVPPSKVSAITAPVKPPPAQPKLLVMKLKDSLRLQLAWVGDKPGVNNENYKVTPDQDKDRIEIQNLAKKLADEYHKNYPEEKTLQIGMGGEVPYQMLISVMDGVRESIPDMVLISHNEVDAETKRSGLE